MEQEGEHLGRELLSVLREIRTTFTRDADGAERVSNPHLKYQLEVKSEALQRKIGLNNKKKIAERLGCKISELRKERV